ncbi:hypothetical protein TrVE_jg4770 [Triparma verrucosa]|uniref:IMP-specific 5'-nucleotidase 1 n=1 Tax=Triparma verrucosa TaxID=1606542 RepID=A0A9W7F5A1_9STRA|nr:hypothetical protein TrVE_jg4770 [Triparma verrucosa]
MSFSSRRRNYMLTPHRRDGLIEWMKHMLQHSFVLDCLAQTAPTTFQHFEELIDEHRMLEGDDTKISKLQILVPTIGTFHTPLPLCAAFLIYDEKYSVTSRRHVTLSFNEIRQILNLSQVMALCSPFHASPPTHTPSPQIGLSITSPPPSPLPSFTCPKIITFDGDQTLYSDGSNFESNPSLASSLHSLLKNGITLAVVTAAGYEYSTSKYALRLTGLLKYFKEKGLTEEEAGRFYMFGGECNYLMRMNGEYELEAVKENGPGGWITSTKHLPDTPGNWSPTSITSLLSVAHTSLTSSLSDMKLPARVILKKRAVGLIPLPSKTLPRECLDECVLRVQSALHEKAGEFENLPYCAFNGGTDAWVDVGNKRVGVEILQAYLGLLPTQCLHIGDQFLNTGNDYAARTCSPCAWITCPGETGYILKKILEIGGATTMISPTTPRSSLSKSISLGDMTRRASVEQCDPSVTSDRSRTEAVMDVYTGEILPPSKKPKT